MKGAIKLLLAVFLITFFTSFNLATVIRAADAVITCDSSGCSGISGSIFNETNLSPGGSISKSVKVINNYAEARNFLVEVIGFSDSTPSLADQLMLSVTEDESAGQVYGKKTLTEFNDDGEVTLSSVPAGDERNYSFLVNFAGVGNDYQGRTMSFDLRLGFEEISSSSVAGSSDSPSNGTSGGEVLGATTENVMGNVLGLSATGGNTFIYLISGLLLVILGLFLTLITLRRKNDVFKIRRIFL